MFGIFFKDKGVSINNENGMHVLASISLGEYVEELHIPIDYWDIEEYKKRWATSIADGIEKKKHSVFITSMHEPESLNFISALIVFNIEPDTFSTFFDALYWATVSLTTVGYGDIYAVSYAGKIITMLSALMGIAIVALPAGIITAGYMDELNRKGENS